MAGQQRYTQKSQGYVDEEMLILTPEGVNRQFLDSFLYNLESELHISDSNMGRSFTASRATTTTLFKVF